MSDYRKVIVRLDNIYIHIYKAYNEQVDVAAMCSYYCLAAANL